MMSSPHHRFAALLGCAVLLSGCNLGCWFMPCHATLEVGVVVKDPSGAAIPDVHVAFLDSSGETDGNGCVKIDGMTYGPADNVGILVEKAGYKPLREDKPLDGYRIDITLQPTSSSKASSAVWTPATSIASLDCN